MIYVKVETQSRREKKPKPRYYKGEDWEAIFKKMALLSTHPDLPVWHTVKLHTISESEYNRHTHPQFNV